MSSALTAFGYDRIFDQPFPIRWACTTLPRAPLPTAPAIGHAPQAMVGYELLAKPQRDITAEKTAERLRALD